MAKYSKEQLTQKIEYAKQLYCKGFDNETIARIIGGVASTTVASWARENDFEKAKRSQVFSIRAMQSSILESYSDMSEGRKPKVTPDAAVKYAKAFETLSNKKQVLCYMYEAFEILTDDYHKDIARTKNKDDREILFDEMKAVRIRMEKVITEINNEILGNNEN